MRPKTARSIIRGCDIAVHSSFDIVAFACSNSAPKFRAKTASRYTNAVQRWPKMRPKIDHPDSLRTEIKILPDLAKIHGPTISQLFTLFHPSPHATPSAFAQTALP